MDLRAIQTAVTTQLGGAFAGTSFSAQELPESESDYQRAVPNPIAYVLCTGSETIEIVSTDPVVQRRRLKFNVECYGRLLYGATGLFALRQLLESALIGYLPPNCDRLYLVKDDVNRGDDNIWCHVYNLECLTMLVQDNFSEPIIVPSFQDLGEPTENFNDDFNTDFGEGQNH
jgi:hypothetical protein